jgi:hypothetical protein
MCTPDCAAETWALRIARAKLALNRGRPIWSGLIVRNKFVAFQINPTIPHGLRVSTERKTTKITQPITAHGTTLRCKATSNKFRWGNNNDVDVVDEYLQIMSNYVHA